MVPIGKAARGEWEPTPRLIALHLLKSRCLYRELGILKWQALETKNLKSMFGIWVFDISAWRRWPSRTSVFLLYCRLRKRELLNLIFTWATLTARSFQFFCCYLLVVFVCVYIMHIPINVSAEKQNLSLSHSLRVNGQFAGALFLWSGSERGF